MPQDPETAAVVRSLIDLLTVWGLNVVGAVAVLLIGRAVAGWGRRFTRRSMERASADPALVPFVASGVYFLILVFVIIAVLGIFGVPTASFVAVLGAVGLAIGLAFQGTFSNFASGVMLLTFRPITVGDYVDVAGTTGTVEAIGIFSTTLNTPDNVRTIVPNSRIFGETIKNYSANDRRRIDLVVGVGYDDDLEVAAGTMRSVLEAEGRVLDEPAPVVAVHELGGSSVDFVVRPWCATEDYWQLRWDLTRSLKEELDRAECDIPYPQRDVHLFQASGE